MKTNIFTLPVTLCISIVLVSGCSSSKSSTKKNPYPGSPYPEQRKTSDKSPSGNPTEKNPTASQPTNLPPGQAKKIYGEKSAKVFAPGQRKKYGDKYYPLIIIRTPDIVILRHADGRYFHKNADNFIYWKGDDERYYLDEQYLDKVEYDKNEVDDWKGKGKEKAKKSPPGQQKKEDEEKQNNGNGKDKKKSKKD